MRTLYIGGLPPETNVDDLLDMVSTFAAVSARVMRRDAGGSRGFGYVTFESRDAALKALAHLDGKPVGECTLRVDLAR